MHRVASVTTMYNEDQPFSESAPHNKDMVLLSKDIFLKTIDSILSARKEHDEPFMMADFGAADGGATIDLTLDLAEYIMKTEICEETADIVVMFDDIPGNNFNALVKRIYGEECSREVPDNVHFLMSAQSMYRNCLPRCSLDLGFCCQFALQWLSARPTKITNGIFTADANEQEMRLIQEQAVNDWITFLVCRGKELKPGGCIVAFVGAESEGDNGNRTGLIPFPYKRVSNVLKEFCINNKITQEEFENINVDNYLGRTESDFRAAFEDESVKQQRLEMVSYERVKHMAIPYLLKCEASDDELVKAHAKKVTRFVRSCLYNAIVAGLSNKREEAEKKDIAETFFDNLYDLILQEEPNVCFVKQYAQIVVRKKLD